MAVGLSLSGDRAKRCSHGELGFSNVKSSFFTHGAAGATFF